MNCSFPFLDSLSGDERRFFSSFLSEKIISAGDVLFDYGDPAEISYLLLDGRLAVHKYTGFQEKLQVVALLDPGAIVGEAAFVPNHVRQTRIVAIEDCRLYGLAREDFTSLKEQHGDLACRFFEHILHIVTLRLEKTSDRLARVL